MLCTIFGFAQLIQSRSPALKAMHQRGVDKILKVGWYLLDFIGEIPVLVQVDSPTIPYFLSSVARWHGGRGSWALFESARTVA